MYQLAAEERNPDKLHALISAVEALLFMHGQVTKLKPPTSKMSEEKRESIARTTRDLLELKTARLGWPGLVSTPRKKSGAKAAAAHEKGRGNGGASRGQRAVVRTVLISDDNERIRFELRGLIESHTLCKVCGEAVNGAEAMEKTFALRPDLLILDLMMPRMNGLEVAAALREKKYSKAIMLYTVHADYVPVEEAGRLALTVVSKTADIFVVMKQIEKLAGVQHGARPKSVG